MNLELPALQPHAPVPPACLQPLGGRLPERPYIRWVFFRQCVSAVRYGVSFEVVGPWLAVTKGSPALPHSARSFCSNMTTRKLAATLRKWAPTSAACSCPRPLL